MNPPKLKHEKCMFYKLVWQFSWSVIVAFLVLSSLISTPTHGNVVMLDELGLRRRFHKHVSRLVFWVDGINSNLASINLISEVVVLNIDVLGTLKNIGNSSKFDCTMVIFFKNTTMCSWFGATMLESKLVGFFGHSHDEWNSCLQGHREAMSSLSVVLRAIFVWSCEVQWTGQLAYMMM